MKSRAFYLLALLALCVPLSARAVANETTAPAAAAIAEQAGFDQKLGATIPLDAVFRDENNQPLTLGYLLGETKRPAVLVLGYKECPMLCSQVLGSLVETLTELRPTTGRDFDVIDVSVDPRQPPSDAAAQKRLYFKRYARAGADAGWHFLTSPDEGLIHRLADAVGFRYAYDPVTKQYAHPAGIVVLTPEGRVSQYLFGVTYDAATLRAALGVAGERKVGSPIEQLLMVCFHFNPVSGKYGALIIGVLRGAGALTLLCLGGLFVHLVRREPVRV